MDVARSTLEPQGLLDRMEAEQPDTRKFFSKFSGWPSQLATCIVAGLVLRISAFGDPAVHIDEAWYFLVGQWMHEGALPYVDLWDRKPFLLFGLYYLFAGISDSVLAYQIPAWIAASLTAFTIVRMATRWTGTQGALLAGVCYLALLDLFAGIGGQSPVFYNLLIATAALLMVRSFDRLQEGEVPRAVWLAMLLAGLAIMVKQTTLFESAFFGLWAVFLLWRSGRPLPLFKIAGLALIGAAPTLAVAAFYWLNGHWFEFWHAMVTSNASKQGATSGQLLRRTIAFILDLWLMAAVVIAAFRCSLKGSPYRPFLLVWAIVALIAYWSVPNAYVHYALPLMVPFGAVAASELNRKTLGVLIAGILTLYGAWEGRAFEFQRTQANRASLAELARMISAHSPRGTLLVYDAPPLLYTVSGTRSLSPLTFPNHLNEEPERNVSHLDTRDEMVRILAARPGAVAISTKPRMMLYNRENVALVLAYTQQHCRRIGEAQTREIGRSDTIVIFGDCS